VGPIPVGARVYSFYGLDRARLRIVFLFFIMHSGDRHRVSITTMDNCSDVGAATVLMPVAIVGLGPLLPCSIVVVIYCSFLFYCHMK
jgi:hypothetical protein